MKSTAEFGPNLLLRSVLPVAVWKGRGKGGQSGEGPFNECRKSEEEGADGEAVKEAMQEMKEMTGEFESVGWGGGGEDRK